MLYFGNDVDARAAVWLRHWREYIILQWRFVRCCYGTFSALTASDVAALHGQLPEVVAGVVKAILDHRVVSQLFEDSHRLLL